MLPGILLISSQPQEFGEFSEYLEKKGYNFEKIPFDGLAIDEKLETGEYLITASVLDSEKELKLCELTDIREKHKNVFFLIFCRDEETETNLHLNKCCHPFTSLLIPYEEKLLEEKLTDITDRVLLEKKREYMLSKFDYIRDRIKSGEAKIDFPASKRIRQVNIGLFHGAGFGGILTTMSMMLRKKKLNEESGKYEVSPMTFSLFEENYDVARSLVNGLTKAQAILMDSTKIAETIEAAELEQIFFDLSEKLQPMLQLKKQHLLISDIPEQVKTQKIIYDREYMNSSFNELLINAMKYSPEQSNIYVLFFYENGELHILMVNKADKNEDNTLGVEPFFENMVFESFFRINNVCHEGYWLEEFQAGIGLAVVKWIIERHYGEIHILNLDNEDEEKEVVVSLKLKCV